MTRLSTRALNRTLWVRQQLVAGHRTAPEVTSVVAHVLGLQAQDNLPPYLSLAARLDAFVPTDLSDLLGSRDLVRFFSMRGTVHVLTPADALALRPWVQPMLDRVSATNQTGRPASHLTTAELDAVVRPFLDGGARPHPEIGEALAEAFPEVPVDALRHVARERLPLLQTPPRGQWKKGGGVVYAYADDWLGSPFTEPDVEQLVLRYLAAYGPATAADMTAWSRVTRLGPVFSAMAKQGRLSTCTDETGRTRYDVPGAAVVDEDLPLPALLLGLYDNVFLSHADREHIAPESARKGWMGANGGAGSTLFLDGFLAGLWRVVEGRVQLETFRRPTTSEKLELDAEVDRIETLLAHP